MDPKQVGPYRISARIGSGGMGVVYRATPRDGAPVALKVLASNASDDTLARFRREAGIRLEHPNVVRVLDTGVCAEAGPWIAMELLEGDTFEERLRRGDLGGDRIVEILVAIARGLAAAHRAGVVHRDLKPENVFLCADGAVKILDFGVAHLEAQASLTETGAIVGTPAYLAPEQARGARSADPRIDVWALGATAYRAFAGTPPFDRGSPLATLLAILVEDVPPLASVARDVPPWLSTIVQRCLARDAGDRWPDAQSLADALATGAASAGRAPPEPPPRPTLPPDEERLVAVLLVRRPLDVAAVEHAIASLGGAPIRLLGDHVVGLFGTARTTGDEPVLAARAGLEIRHLASAVAVSAGRAHAAPAGALGGTAIEAAERACDEGIVGVGVDARTAAVLARSFALEPVAASPPAFELVAEHHEDWAPASLPDERFVGRERELALLADALAHAERHERASALCVWGPPGIGKSQLRRRVERWERAHLGRATWLLGAGDRLGSGVALSTLGGVLRRRADGASRDGPRLHPRAPLTEQRQAILRLAREALGEGAQARACADFLGVLCGVSMPETPTLQAARADPELMRDRLRLALLDWLEGLASRGPVILVVEDAHFADASSRALLAEALQRLEQRPFVVIEIRRDEPRAPLVGQSIELDGLHAGASRELVASLAGASLSDAAIDEVVASSAGHPLFLEHVTRARLEEARDGSGEITRPIPLPLTVEAALQARLDLLPRAERDACLRASVLARPFDAAQLDALGVESASAALEALSRRGLLEIASDSSPSVYRFRSSLACEVAYRTLSAGARAELHRRAAAWLESRHEAADREEIAEHLEQGGDAAAATGAWLAAARRAHALGDSLAILRCTERAATLGPPPGSAFELHMLRADANRFLGRRDAWGRELADALEEAGADERARARALVDRSGWLARASRVDEATADAREAIACAARASAHETLALAHARLAEALAFAHRYDDASDSLGRARAIVQASAPQAAGKVAAASALVATRRGDPSAARAAYLEAIAAHRASGDVRRLVFNEQNLADVSNRLGAHADAERALRAALEGARRVANRLAEGYVLANLGYACAHQGRHAEALDHLASAAEVAERTGDVPLAVAIGLYRARALLDAGRPAEAREAAEAVAARAEASVQRGMQALALAVEARATLRCGDAPRAADRATSALALRDELGGVEEDEAEIFVAAAEALDALGRRDRARAVRARGRARLDELASRIHDAAWRERFRHGIATHRALDDR